MKKQIKRTLAMVMAIAIVICAYSIGSIADSNVSLKEYSVIDIKNNIKTIGRTGTTTNGIYCDWTASGIEFSANCSGSVSVTVNTVATVDGTSGNDKDAYFTLYIDNIRQESRVKFVDGTNTVTIANNLESGNHTFKLVKQTEYYLAKCEFTKISLNGTLNSKPDKSKYVIEYIGDSITCGYSSINSGSDNWAPKNQDGTRTYAYLAAENFGAEARVVSRSSGKCTDTNENINLYNLYSYFDKYRSSSLKYDFSLQKPNALVFALGTNDGTQSVSYWETQFKAFSDLVRGGYNDYNIPIIVDMNFMKSNDNMRLNMVKALTNIKNANSTKYSKIYLTSSGSSCDNHPRTDSHLASANKLTRDLIEYGVFTTEDLKSDATTLVTSTSSDSNILNSFDTVVSPNDTTNISAEAVSSICNDSGKAVKYTANGSQTGSYPTYNITLGTIKNSSHATKGISFTIKYHNKSGTAKPSIVLYNSKTNHSTSYELSLSDNVTTTVNIDFDYLNSFMNLMHSEIGTGCNIGVYLNIGAANCEFTIDNAYLTLNSYKTATNSNSSYTYRSDYKYPIISETSQPSTTKTTVNSSEVENKYLHVVSNSNDARALSLPLTSQAFPAGTKKIQIDVKSSKAQTITGGISLRKDKVAINGNGKVGLNLTYTTEWNTVTLDVSSIAISNYHSYAILISAGNLNVDFYYDNLKFLDAEGNVLRVENDYESYDQNYQFNSGNTTYGSGYDCYNWAGTAEILADKATPSVTTTTTPSTSTTTVSTNEVVSGKYLKVESKDTVLQTLRFSLGSSAPENAEKFVISTKGDGKNSAQIYFRDKVDASYSTNNTEKENINSTTEWVRNEYTFDFTKYHSVVIWIPAGMTISLDNVGFILKDKSFYPIQNYEAFTKGVITEKGIYAGNIIEGCDTTAEKAGFKNTKNWSIKGVFTILECSKTEEQKEPEEQIETDNKYLQVKHTATSEETIRFSFSESGVPSNAKKFVISTKGDGKHQIKLAFRSNISADRTGSNVVTSEKYNLNSTSSWVVNEFDVSKCKGYKSFLIYVPADAEFCLDDIGFVLDDNTFKDIQDYQKIEKGLSYEGLLTFGKKTAETEYIYKLGFMQTSGWSFTGKFNIKVGSSRTLSEVGEFSMETGAQIRLNDVAGLRFLAKVDAEKINSLKKAGYTVSMGTIIAPVDTFSGELTLETEGTLIVPYENDEFYKENGNNYIAGSIVNIKESNEYDSTSGNITRPMAARAFITLKKDGQSKTIYASNSNHSYRSVKYVAAACKKENGDFYKKYKSQIDKWAEATSNKYSIINYGVYPNTYIDYTDNIQKALDDCWKAGGGEVIVPSGKYTVSSIRVRSNTSLHLLKNSTLDATRNLDEYDILDRDTLEPISDEYKTNLGYVDYDKRTKPEDSYWLTKAGSRWNRAVIRVVDAKNVSIIGEEGSVINGNNSYDNPGKSCRSEQDYRGAHGLDIWYVENLTLKGYTVLNSGNWAHALFYINDYEIDNVTCLGGHDGIDIRYCDNGNISNCKFDCGDDSFAGVDNQNVYISNCVAASACNFARIAGYNVVFDNCTVNGTTNYGFRYPIKDSFEAVYGSNTIGGNHTMLTFFKYYGDDQWTIRQKSDITFKNCTVTNCPSIMEVDPMIGVYMQKGLGLGKVTFQNMKFNNLSKPSIITGQSDTDSYYVLDNTKMNFSSSFKNNYSSAFDVTNFKNITFKNGCTITNGPANLIVKSSASTGNIELGDLTSDGGLNIITK